MGSTLCGNNNLGWKCRELESGPQAYEANNSHALQPWSRYQIMQKKDFTRGDLSWKMSAVPIQSQRLEEGGRMAETAVKECRGLWRRKAKNILLQKNAMLPSDSFQASGFQNTS